MRLGILLSLLLTSSLSFAQTEGISPLMKAAAQGQHKQVQKLLKSKNPVDALDSEGRTALYYAMDNEEEEIAIRLINAGADLSLKFGEYKETYLALAIRYNLFKVVRKIVSKKPDLVNETDTAGMTPLMRSVRSSPKDVIEYLLKSGAKKELKNLEGRTALDIAQKAQNKEAIELLSSK